MKMINILFQDQIKKKIHLSINYTIVFSTKYDKCTDNNKKTKQQLRISSIILLKIFHDYTWTKKIN